MTHQQQPQLANRSRRVGEVAGNTTAECAAICCCVPCTVMDMVALATYKVPACLWKKAVQKKKKKRLQKNLKKIKKNETTLLDHKKPNGPGTGPETVIVKPNLEEHFEETPEDDVKLEDEMWARFNVNGFWRSESQRQEPELQTGEKNR
ncbi:hypothetical protein L195_g017232 [Trifolium pratense]|uniref:Uncharacterized protein n=1 Tax=Trifolium pratense TaxID=57577 RepID=A0A2K3MTD4_TRIPR|nr:uncharacterized protein LOC123898561 [Trifolium pratense]PNX94065.1 hypothetical protein L195_g017232 [Trifolium pratense]